MYMSKENNIPMIGMGSTQFWMGDTKRAEQAMQMFIENYGPVMIDTAEMYGHGKCESAVGDVLKHVNHDSVYLVGKILPDNATKYRFERSLNHSLDRLGVDTLDLYLLHWREHCDLSYLVQAMNEAVEEGKIRHWGVSNFDMRDMNDLLAVPGGEKCYCNQILYNMYTRGPEYDLIPLLNKNNMHTMSYSSLGSKYGQFVCYRKFQSS